MRLPLILSLLPFLLLPTLSPGKGPKLPPPTQGTPLSSAATDRIYCLPQVIEGLKRIWMDSGNGMLEEEASFEVSSIGGVYINPFEPGRRNAQTVYIWGNTVAVFHTHPHGMMWPSTPTNNAENNGMGDTGLADKEHIDVYVVTQYGLTRYRPGFGNSIERDGMSWTKACPK